VVSPVTTKPYVIPAQAGIHARRRLHSSSDQRYADTMFHTPLDPCIYILASARNGQLYIGVTSRLFERMQQHQHGVFDGYTKRYGIKMLVYYEMHATMEGAIRREKKLKDWQRAWKVRLIEQMNPEWRDLFEEASGILEVGPGGQQSHS